MPTPQSGNIASGFIDLEGTTGPDGGKFILLNGSQLESHQIIVGCDASASGIWVEIWDRDPEAVGAVRLERFKLNANTSGDDARPVPFWVPAACWLQLTNGNSTTLIGCYWVSDEPRGVMA